MWEWCFDVYDASAYANRSGTTLDPLVTSGSEFRVTRGGSWYNNARDARSASRLRHAPGGRGLGGGVGFRVVR